MNKLSLYDQRFKLECDLTTHVENWLDAQMDITYWKASDRFNKGVSDIIMCINGLFVAAELKRADGTASAHQKIFIAKIVGKGKGIAGECFTVNEVIALVDKARSIAVKLRETLANGEL